MGKVDQEYDQTNGVKPAGPEYKPSKPAGPQPLSIEEYKKRTNKPKPVPIPTPAKKKIERRQEKEIEAKADRAEETDRSKQRGAEAEILQGIKSSRLKFQCGGGDSIHRNRKKK